MKSTKDLIIEAAFFEFSNNTYDLASINSICAYGNFSKGIVYHYFKNKDALYVYCVKECFDELADYIESHLKITDDLDESIKAYYALRTEYFRLNPLMQGIFVNALFNTPQKLTHDIISVKQNFDNCNKNFFKRVLSNVRVKSNYTLPDIIEYFEIASQGVISELNKHNVDSHENLLKQQEIKMNDFINIILFGITERVD